MGNEQKQKRVRKSKSELSTFDGKTDNRIIELMEVYKDDKECYAKIKKKIHCEKICKEEVCKGICKQTSPEYTSKRIRQRFTTILNKELCNEPLDDRAKSLVDQLVEEDKRTSDKVSWVKMVPKVEEATGKLYSDNPLKNYWNSKHRKGQKNMQADTIQAKTDEKSQTNEMKMEEVKVDETQAGEMQADKMQADETQVDVMQADEMQVDEMKVDERQTDETQADDMKVDEMQTDKMKVDISSTPPHPSPGEASPPLYPFSGEGIPFPTSHPSPGESPGEGITPPLFLLLAY